MIRGKRVFDADLHVIEPADLWTSRMEKRFRDHAPKGYERFPQDVFMHLNGRDLPAFTADQVAGIRKGKEAASARYAHALAKNYNNVSQVEAMDAEGIDACVLFPTRGLYAIAPEHATAEFASDVARVYNDWLGEFAALDPKRMRGATMIAPQDVERAVAEIRRTVKDYGFKAVFLRPNPYGKDYWHHPKYDPIWAVCQELDIPACFHEGGPGMMQGVVRQIGDDRFDTIRMAHTISHPGEMMTAVIAMCMGGPLQRFPKLRVAFLEANCGWAPWLLWRMDEHVEKKIPVGSDTEILPLNPSEYFLRQCVVSLECDEEPGIDVINRWKGENIVFSTDYPHTDSKYPNSVKHLLDGLKIDDAYMTKLLWDTTAKLYRHDQW